MLVRLLFIISFIFLLGSCAHNRIRFVKANKPTVVHVDRAERNAHFNPINKADFDEEVSLCSTETAKAEDLLTTSGDFIETETSARQTPPAPEDSTGSAERKVNASMINEALDAEDDAKAAKGLFIGALVTMWIPIVSIASLVLFIIGWIKLDRANRSRYITKKGERHSWTATILRNIYLALVFLLLLLILLLVFFF